MAFETTNIYSTDHSLLLAYLQEHAVPDYFDKVEADAETATTISCYVGDTVLLQFALNSSGGTLCYINTATGLQKTIPPTSNTLTIVYAHKSANGLAFTWGLAATVESLPSLIITKDSDENTAIVAAGKTGNISSLIQSVAAVTANDMAILAQGLSTRLTAAVTTVVPFVCGCGAGECRYTPNVVYFPTAQYTDPGEIIVNGSRYLSNGYWALKDE